MKKQILTVLLAAGMWSFQACNNSTNTDSVEAAQDSNENSMATGVPEDDSEFLTEAASGGMMEVQLGKMAQEKAMSPDVKSFGEMMVTDHSKANEELKTLAASKNVTIPSTPGEDAQKHMDDLSKLSGMDFDKKYVDMMVDDHQKDIDEFKDAADNAKDANVRSFASNTLPTLQKHYDAIKAIQDKMK